MEKHSEDLSRNALDWDLEAYEMLGQLAFEGFDSEGNYHDPELRLEP